MAIKYWQWLLILLGIFILIVVIYIGFTENGHEIWKAYKQSIQKTEEPKEEEPTPEIDDRITDEDRKRVEDMCRSMMASWEAEIELYKKYKDVDKETAEVMKSDANEIAEAYNKYIFENSYVWEGNMPDDIYAVIDPFE